ncbi:zinc finger protein 844-like, partial [Sigmodon hispidus]
VSYRNPMNVINVVKPLKITLLQNTTVFKDIKEDILERNPMDVINVIKPLLIIRLFKDIKEDILERNPMNVINACLN